MPQLACWLKHKLKASVSRWFQLARQLEEIWLETSLVDRVVVPVVDEVEKKGY